jgi:membrane protein implicated in regulation of membrane protease activity
MEKHTPMLLIVIAALVVAVAVQWRRAARREAGLQTRIQILRGDLEIITKRNKELNFLMEQARNKELHLLMEQMGKGAK